MEGSIFGRLPGELRNRVYDLILTKVGGLELTHGLARDRLLRDDVELLKTYMALLAVSKQMRSEISGLLYEKNELAINLLYRRDALRRHAALPPAIKPSGGTIVLLITADLDFYFDHDPVEYWTHTARNLKPILNVVRPNEVIFDFVIQTHRAAEPHNLHEDYLYSRHQCKKGHPMSMNDTGLMRFRFSNKESWETRVSITKDAFARKKEQLSLHADHKLCPIKLEVTNLLKGLEKKRPTVLALVAAMPADVFDEVPSLRAGLEGLAL